MSANGAESGDSAETYPFTMAWPVADAGYSWRRSSGDVLRLFTRLEAEQLHREGKDLEAVARDERSKMTDPEGPYLVANAGSTRLYNPLAIDDFHRIFASTRPTESGIHGFASKYGDLGIGDKLRWPDDTITSHTHLNDWRDAVSLLADVIDLWDRVNSNNDSRIEQCFKRDHTPGRRSVKWKREDHDDELVAIETNPDKLALLELWDKGPVAQAAWQWVRQLLLDGLRDETIPIVHSNRRDGFGFVPRTLIAAAYVSLGLEITGRRGRMRMCPVCGRRFRPVRRDKRFCSDGCRIKNHREEQKLKTESKSEDSEGSKEG